MRNISALLVALVLAGCVVGPDYSAPDAPTPARFDAAQDTSTFDHHTEQRFWRGFDDPQLATLIEHTLGANLDLNAALARYDSAQALLDGARREQWPSITASASAAEHHFAAVDRAPGTPPRAERYQAGIGAHWELDLFGRLQHATASRRAELEAAGADLHALQISLIGQLASSYFELRSLQQQYQIAEQHVTNQQATLAIVSARLQAGRGTEFDRVRAEAQLETTRAALPGLQAAIGTQMHRIAVLAGHPPAALHGLLREASPLPEILPTIPVGSPGEALRRRPDIRAAERRLAAATSRVGMATADLFPRFTLDGLLGASTGDGQLFSREAESRRIALGIDWTFLDTSRVRARINAADAQSRAALAHYQQTVLLALEETETQLLRHQHYQHRTATLMRAATAAEKARQLAQARYQQGFIGYIEVLNAEQEVIAARDALLNSRTAEVLAMVGVYRALAGAPQTATPHATLTSETHAEAHAEAHAETHAEPHE